MKRPIIEDDLAKRVQAYANKNCDGNFTQAVTELISGALLAIKIESKRNNRLTAGMENVGKQTK